MTRAPDHDGIVIYGRASSSNVQAVMWGAAEMGVPVTRIDCGEGFGGLDTPEFLAANPVGRIPALRDGLVTVFESAAILRYLAAKTGEAWWPADPANRAQLDQWAEWAKQDPATLFTGPIFWRVVRTPAPRRDPQAIRDNVDRFEAALSHAEAQLTRHDWLAGDHISLGDLHLGHVLYRYFDIDIVRRDFPALRAYYDRLTRRAPYRTHVMLNYDALRDTI